MVFGARPIGSRTFGDGTGNSGNYATGATEDLGTVAGTVSVTGTIILADLEDISMAGTIVLDAVADIGTVEFIYPNTATVAINGNLSIPPKGTRRQSVVTDIEGNPLPNGGLANVDHGPITWRLNEPTEWQLASKTVNPALAPLFDEEFQEVQLWRGDMLLTWGPTVTPSVDDDISMFAGYDPLWYLKQLHVGRAERANYVVNGSFEDGLAGWNIGNYTPIEAYTEGAKPQYTVATLDPTRAVTGKYSMKIDLPSDTYPIYGGGAGQIFLWLVDSASKDGDEWSMGIHIYIPSSTFRSVESGAALHVSRYSTSEYEDVYNIDGVYVGSFPKQLEDVTAPITQDFPLDKWTRLSARLYVPLTGEIEWLQFTVVGVRGVINIDDAVLSYNERLEWFSEDQSNIATSLVEHAQDPDYGKVSLNLACNAPLSGTPRDLTVLFSEHVNVFQVLQSITLLDDGFDMRMQLSPTTRTVMIESPNGGSIRPKFPLQFRAEIHKFHRTFDGEIAANAVVTLGESYGSERDEGFAEDTSAYANNIVLEEVFPAAPGTPASNLDNIARERISVSRAPVVLEFWTGPNPEMATKILGGLRVGDIVPVTIYHGPLEIPGVYYRLVEMTLDPDDNIHGTLNLRSDLV